MNQSVAQLIGQMLNGPPIAIHGDRVAQVNAVLPADGSVQSGPAGVSPGSNASDTSASAPDLKTARFDDLLGAALRASISSSAGELVDSLSSKSDYSSPSQATQAATTAKAGAASQPTRPGQFGQSKSARLGGSQSRTKNSAVVGPSQAASVTSSDNSAPSKTELLVQALLGLGQQVQAGPITLPAKLDPNNPAQVAQIVGEILNSAGRGDANRAAEAVTPAGANIAAHAASVVGTDNANNGNDANNAGDAASLGNAGAAVRTIENQSLSAGDAQASLLSGLATERIASSSTLSSPDTLAMSDQSGPRRLLAAKGGVESVMPWRAVRSASPSAGQAPVAPAPVTSATPGNRVDGRPVLRMGLANAVVKSELETGPITIGQSGNQRPQSQLASEPTDQANVAEQSANRVSNGGIRLVSGISSGEGQGTGNEDAASPSAEALSLATEIQAANPPVEPEAAFSPLAGVAIRPGKDASVAVSSTNNQRASTFGMAAPAKSQAEELEHLGTQAEETVQIRTQAEERMPAKAQAEGEPPAITPTVPNGRLERVGGLASENAQDSKAAIQAISPTTETVAGPQAGLRTVSTAGQPAEGPSGPVGQSGQPTPPGQTAPLAQPGQLGQTAQFGRPTPPGQFGSPTNQTEAGMPSQTQPSGPADLFSNVALKASATADNWSAAQTLSRPVTKAAPLADDAKPAGDSAEILAAAAKQAGQGPGQPDPKLGSVGSSGTASAQPGTGGAESFDASANAERIARALGSQLQGRVGGSIRLQLDPPGLGHMQVEMSLESNSVKVTLLPSADSTAQLLTGQLHQLRDGLESRGLAVASLNVERPQRVEQPAASRQDQPGEHNSGSGGQGGGAQHGQQQGQGPWRFQGPESPSADAGAAQQITANGNVNSVTTAIGNLNFGRLGPPDQSLDLVG